MLKFFKIESKVRKVWDSIVLIWFLLYRYQMVDGGQRMFVDVGFWVLWLSVFLGRSVVMGMDYCEDILFSLLEVGYMISFFQRGQKYWFRSQVIQIKGWVFWFFGIFLLGFYLIFLGRVSKGKGKGVFIMIKSQVTYGLELVKYDLQK